MNRIGKNVEMKGNVILGDNVIIEDDVFIDYNCIIRSNVHIKKNTVIGANCILGEYGNDFLIRHEEGNHPLLIGEDSFVRSGSILYGDCVIGDHFQTGHQVTIREFSKIGSHVSIGTLSDIQGYCSIGNYVRAHSNVFIGQKTEIKDYVWIFPYVVFTNDPTPPSEELVGATVESFAVVSTGSVILPGVVIHEDALVGAGAIVTKDVEKMAVVVGNPARRVADVTKIKNRITGKPVYPWRYTFDRNMPWENQGYEKWYADVSKSLEGDCPGVCPDQASCAVKKRGNFK